MKKATVIVIAAIYVASIVIVGVFGLKAVVRQEFIPIVDFILPESIYDKEVKLATDGSGYTVRLTYTEGLSVPIDYTPVPADATYRNDVEVTIAYQTDSSEDTPTATLDKNVFGGYTLVFHKEGLVRIRIASIDGSKFTKELTITALK